MAVVEPCVYAEDISPLGLVLNLGSPFYPHLNPEYIPNGEGPHIFLDVAMH